MTNELDFDRRNGKKRDSFELDFDMTNELDFDRRNGSGEARSKKMGGPRKYKLSVVYSRVGD